MKRKGQVVRLKSRETGAIIEAKLFSTIVSKVIGSRISPTMMVKSMFQVRTGIIVTGDGIVLTHGKK